MPSVPVNIGIALSRVVARGPWRVAALAAVLIACLLNGAPAVFGAEATTGQAIYQAECARCHGPMGEGTKKTTRPLFGDKSSSQLTSLIRRTMPDDDPGSCTDEEYRKVAAYIY